jgi:hypothetical protein
VYEGARRFERVKAILFEVGYFYPRKSQVVWGNYTRNTGTGLYLSYVPCTFAAVVYLNTRARDPYRVATLIENRDGDRFDDIRTERQPTPFECDRD